MKTTGRTRGEMIQDMLAKAADILTKLEDVENELKEKPFDPDIKRAYLEGLSPRWLRIATLRDFTNWNEVSRTIEELEAFVTDLEKAIKKPMVQNALSLLGELLELFKVEQTRQAVGWADTCLEAAQKAEIKAVIDVLKQALARARKLGEGQKRQLNAGLGTHVKEFSTKIANVQNLNTWVTEAAGGIDIAWQAQDQLDKAIALWSAKEGPDQFFKEVLNAVNNIRNQWDQRDFESGTTLLSLVSHFRNVADEAKYLEGSSGGLISAFEGWLGLLSEKARSLLAAMACETQSSVANYRALVERLQGLGQESSDVLKWERPITHVSLAPDGDKAMARLIRWEDVLSKVDPAYRPSFDEAFKYVRESLSAVHSQNQWKDYHRALSDLSKHFDNSKGMTSSYLQSEAQRYDKFRSIDRISTLLQELNELAIQIDTQVEKLVDLASYWTSGTLLLSRIKELLKEDLSEPARKLLDIVDKLRQGGVVSFRSFFDEAKRAGLSPTKFTNAIAELEDRGISIIRFE